MNSESDHQIQQNLPLYDSDFSIEEQQDSKKLILKQAINDIQNDESPEVDLLAEEARTVTLNSKPMDFPNSVNAPSVTTPKAGNSSSSLKIKTSSPGLKLKSNLDDLPEQEAPSRGLQFKTALNPEPVSEEQPIQQVPFEAVGESSYVPTTSPLVIKSPVEENREHNFANEAAQETFTNERVITEPNTAINEEHSNESSRGASLQIKHAISTRQVEPEDRQVEQEAPSFDSDLPFMTEAPAHVEAVEAHENILDQAAESSLFLEEEVPEPQGLQSGSNSDLLGDMGKEEPEEESKTPTIYEYDDNDGLGSYLIHARTERSLTVRELSSRTRIKEALIIALEEENTVNFPMPVYAKSTIKNLSSELKISYETTLRLYNELIGTNQDQTYEFTPKTPDPHAAKSAGSAVHKWSAILMAVAVAGIILAGFLIKYIFKAEPYLPENYVINLDEFHPEIKVPTPHLRVPQN